MVGSGEKNLQQAFEDGLQFEGIDILFGVLKLTPLIVLGLYDLYGALSVRTPRNDIRRDHRARTDTCPLPASQDMGLRECTITHCTSVLHASTEHRNIHRA
jgi:hypothetical protein